MLTADYTGGSISAFPIGKGEVGNLCASLKFTGQGPDTVRQASSHIHQLKALSSANGNWILATDLGAVPAFSLKQRILADEVNARGSADIHIHPTGKWLYTSHRLSNDGIAIFNILPDSSLEKVGYARTGRHPRNFMITDDGAYLFVACRDDKIIQIFEILPNGSLLLTGTSPTFEEDKPSSICGL